MKTVIRNSISILFLGSFIFAVYSFFKPKMMYNVIYAQFTKEDYIFKMMMNSWDKQGHFIYMGVSAFMLNYLLKAKTVTFKSFSILLANVLLIIGTSLEEVRQYFVPNRNFDILDLLAGTAGILVFGFLGARLYRFLSR